MLFHLCTSKKLTISMQTCPIDYCERPFNMYQIKILKEGLLLCSVSLEYIVGKELELVSFSAITFLFDVLTPGVHIPERKLPLLSLTFSNVLIHPRWSDSTEDGATHSSNPNEQLPKFYLGHNEYIQVNSVKALVGTPAAKSMVQIWSDSEFSFHKNNFGSWRSISSSHMFHILYKV